MKTVKFLTLGCKVNQYDTQVMRQRLIGAGFGECRQGPADVYLINTCTVTSSADTKSRALIRRCARENPRAQVIVAGCLAELDSQKIVKIPGVSRVIKRQDKEGFVEFMGGSLAAHVSDNAGINAPGAFCGHTRAFLKVQDGCDNFCSYCRVPLARGPSRSRQLDEVLLEARALAAAGFKEIVVSGICLGSYGKDISERAGLAELVSALAGIDGLLRVRLSSIEARDVTQGLINAMADSPKLCRHLHIPLQSGDDAILERMNRRYSRREYLGLVERIRRRMPEAAITTDCLVGFPGEEESHFRNTLSLIKDILPLKVHIFPYSRREGTLAARNFRESADPRVIKERIARLKSASLDCSRDYRKKFTGKAAVVLIEEAKGRGCLWKGYTDNYISALVESRQDLRNKAVRVRLGAVSDDFCFGRLIPDAPVTIC